MSHDRLDVANVLEIRLDDRGVAKRDDEARTARMDVSTIDML